MEALDVDGLDVDGLSMVLDVGGDINDAPPWLVPTRGAEPTHDMASRSLDVPGTIRSGSQGWISGWFSLRLVLPARGTAPASPRANNRTSSRRSELCR